MAAADLTTAEIEAVTLFRALLERIEGITFKRVCDLGAADRAVVDDIDAALKRIAPYLTCRTCGVQSRAGCVAGGEPDDGDLCVDWEPPLEAA